jgi:hypothetical protein
MAKGAGDIETGEEGMAIDAEAMYIISMPKFTRMIKGRMILLYGAVKGMYCFMVLFTQVFARL